uniref:Uncharacterized protein n=1 Tax=Heterorhabditis bacteriophora TaxID=37862 RepID=A0A1I7WII9_HETBA
MSYIAAAPLLIYLPLFLSILIEKNHYKYNIIPFKVENKVLQPVLSFNRIKTIYMILFSSSKENFKKYSLIIFNSK